MKKTLNARQNTRRRHYERRSFLRMERLEDRMVLSGASPVAVNDLYQAIIDEPLSISPTAGVLANDTDAEGDTLSAILFSGPNNGTINMEADGSFLYTPNAGFTGTDSFVYLANDGTSFSQLAAVTLQVTGEGSAPVGNDDSYTVEEDATLNIGFSEGVLANDTDAEGSPLTAALVTGPANGTISLNPDGSFTYIPNANFSGSDSFTYLVSDSANTGNVATVNITVTPVNDLPSAVNDSFSTDEDTQLLGGSVLANDTDPDGDPLTATIQSDVQHGTLALNPDGTFTYTPDADFNGIDGFSYLVSDGQGNSVVATATIVINPVNDLPVAVNDEYSTDEDTALVIAAPGILGNDTDLEGDSLVSILASSPQHGTLTLNADGSFTYTPEADFHGIDGFSYVANDGTGDSTVASVTITVNPVNDDPIATDDAYSLEEDNVLTVDAAAGVLANDTDGDGDALTVALVSGPANGTLSLNADGSFSYTPTANFNGSDSFTYSITDGTATAEATVTLTVGAVNDVPETVNDEYTTNEDTPLTIAAPGVLSNDADADGDSLTVSIVNPPQNGTVTLNADGSFTYTPNADFHGVDGFSYVASDAGASSEVATVTITVNPVADSPVGEEDAYTVDEDAVLTVDAAAGVLANDTDGDGDPLTATLVTGPANGTLTLNTDGSFSYTPNANFNGSDSFTYTAGDGTTSTDPITVSITVNPVSDGPVGEEDAYTVDEDAVLTVDAAAGVLANDTDGDGDPLTATLVTGPANGTLTLNADGSFSYTPNANFNGSDSFTYTAGDGTTSTDPITVSITVNSVNDNPVGEEDAYTVDEDAVLTVDAAAGVLANDTDGDGNPLTATLVTGPANGTLTLNADGSFSYTPNANFNGSDSFTYTAGDGTTSTDPITVSITVNPVSDGPVGEEDAYAVDEDAVLTVDAAAGVLANDADGDGDPLTATLVTGPASGTLTLNADGSFSYTPNANFNGSDSFTYTAGDGATTTDPITVTITIAPVADSPVAEDDAYSVVAGETLNVALPGVLANDTDADGDPLSATVVTGPANGTLTLNADGSFSYTANVGFSGTDTFTYTAGDGTTTDEATVTINVTEDNQGPIAADDEYATDQDVPLVVDAPGLLFNDSDPEADPLTAVLVSGPANGTLTLNADGSFTYTPTTGFTGSDSFVYKATDGSAESEATVTITVNPFQSEPPLVFNDSYSTGEDLTLTAEVALGVLANDFDTEGGTLSATLVTGPDHGTLTLNADGSFTYVPEANWHGTATFTYEATSSEGGSIEATATIVVQPLNDMPVAVADSFNVLPDTELTSSVLDNDSDIDGDTLTAHLLLGPSHGQLTLNSDGTFSYTPDAGYEGGDQFYYQLNDGMANSAVALVSLNVGPIAENQFPASAEDSYTVEAGETLNVAAPGVLGNDSDAESDPLTAVLVAGPANGSLTLNADGSFSYTPNAGFSGSDTFTYQANDGQGVGNVATVTLTVTPEGTTVPIEAGDDQYEVAAETTLNVDLPGVLANDVDEQGDPLTVTLVTGPTNGTLTLNADGSFSYTPAIGFTGSDTFTYQAGDGTNVSNIATVTIDVGSLDNTRPSAGNDSYTVESGDVLEVPADQGVMLDDSDPDGDAITVALFSAPLHGTVTLNADGSFVYTPEAGYVGLDSFLYRVFDGELHSILAAVTIHVVPSTDPDETPVPGDDDCDDELIDLLVAGGIDPTAIDEILAAAGRTV